MLGFIPKAYSPEVMLSAVRLVLAGGVYVPPMMLSAVPPGIVAGVPGGGGRRRGAAGAAVGAHARAPAQRADRAPGRGAAAAVAGQAQQADRARLGISEGTVKIHLAAIFRALNVRNRTEAVVAAQSLTEASAHS